MGSNGDLRARDQVGDLASMADWYDMLDFNISGEAGDVTVSTKWAGMKLCGFHNHATAAGVMLGTTMRDTSFSIRLGAGAFSGKLPAIKTLTKSGSSDDFTLFFQKINDA